MPSSPSRSSAGSAVALLVVALAILGTSVGVVALAGGGGAFPSDLGLALDRQTPVEDSPEVWLRASDRTPLPGQTVRFEVTVWDTGSGVADTEIDFHGAGEPASTDGAPGEGGEPGEVARVYHEPGDYRVTARATDEAGATASVTETIAVGDPDDALRLRLVPNRSTASTDGVIELALVATNVDDSVGLHQVSVAVRDSSVLTITNAADGRDPEQGNPRVRPGGQRALFTSSKADDAEDGTVSLGAIRVAGERPGTAVLDVRVHVLENRDEDPYPYVVTEELRLPVADR